MKLKAPFIIGADLCPALKVADATLSLEFVGVYCGRCQYRWCVDIPEGEFTGTDLLSGTGNPIDYQEAFRSFLDFLLACGDSYRYKMAHPGSNPENFDLFPPPVAEWAYRNHDEISMAAVEIETPGLIEGN